MKNCESVLFLCNHNVIRSVMAEHLFKKNIGDTIYCDSAGVSAGELDGFVVAVMKEVEIDLEQHKPKKLEEIEKKSFDLIITHSPQAHHVALEMEYIKAKEILYWPAADPTVIQGAREQRLQAYRDVRDAINNKISEYFTIHK